MYISKEELAELENVSFSYLRCRNDFESHKVSIEKIDDGILVSRSLLYNLTTKTDRMFKELSFIISQLKSEENG